MKPESFNLSEFLPYRLSVLTARVSRRLSAVYEKEHGLTIPEWRVIAHLGRCTRASVRDFHNCVNMEKPRVSRAIAKLERSGLVKKSPGEDDQRLIEVSLTDQGRRTLEAIVPEALEFQHDLLGALSEEEVRQLVSLMERLHAKLDTDPLAPRRSRQDTG